MGYFFIGEEELLSAFRFVGVHGEGACDEASVREAFRKATGGAYQVLILTEKAADWLGSELIDWQLSGRYPLVVEIPGLSGHLPGRKNLISAIREAIGVHV